MSEHLVEQSVGDEESDFPELADFAGQVAEFRLGSGYEHPECAGDLQSRLRRLALASEVVDEQEGCADLSGQRDGLPLALPCSGPASMARGALISSHAGGIRIKLATSSGVDAWVSSRNTAGGISTRSNSRTSTSSIPTRISTLIGVASETMSPFIPLLSRARSWRPNPVASTWLDRPPDQRVHS